MIYCKKCGVELEEGVIHCPLCATPINNADASLKNLTNQSPFTPEKEMTSPQKRLVWEIISIAILSSVVVTLSIDFLLNQQIKWSEYPVVISMMVFSYISSFAFLKTNALIKIVVGFLGACLFMVLIDMLTFGLAWAFTIGIPLLFLGNLIAIVLFVSFRKLKRKSISFAAYSLVAMGAYSVCIDAVISYSKTSSIVLSWSGIVLASVLPVAAVLLYIHFRLTKNKEIERIFHL